MHESTTHVSAKHHLRLDAAGRIVIPAELRRRWRVEPGDTLLLTEDDTGVRLRTLNEVIRETQKYFRSHIPEGTSLVDELLAQRRADADHE